MAATWLGVLLAYDSYYWPPHGQGWPVSFFVVVLILVFYLLAQVRRLDGRDGRDGRDSRNGGTAQRRADGGTG